MCFSTNSNPDDFSSSQEISWTAIKLLHFSTLETEHHGQQETFFDGLMVVATLKECFELPASL